MVFLYDHLELVLDLSMAGNVIPIFDQLVTIVTYIRVVLKKSLAPCPTWGKGTKPEEARPCLTKY